MMYLILITVFLTAILRLKAEGVNISRRTVAKYRGAMKIPGKAERAAFH